jgi:hypothetical protein
MDARTKNLTLASAKHLLTHRHITQAHHDRIVQAVQAPAAAGMARPPMRPAMRPGAMQPGMLSGLQGATPAAPAAIPAPAEED